MTERAGRRWLAAVLLVGSALRLYSYAANPSLSVDDAMLALNLGTRSFAGLLHPLALEQAAAPLFLWLLKAATVVAGMRDPVLRAVPLVAGCVLPYAVWRVARRVLTEQSALLASAFVAFSPILIQYSVSAKPYEVDALVTMTVTGFALSVCDDPARLGGFLRLALAGVAGVLLSTPAVFVLCAGVVALAVTPAVYRNPGARVRGAGLAVLWAATFAAVYFGVTRTEAMSPYLQRFWSGRMLHPGDVLHPGHAWDVVKRVPIQAFLPFRKLSEPEILSWLALLAGAALLAKRHGTRVVYVAGPIVVGLGASFATLYPVAPRLWLFVAPLVCILLAAALEGDHLAGLGRGAWAVRAVSVVAVAGLGVTALPTGWWPPNSRLLVSTYLMHRAPGQNVYVFSGLVPDWTYYATEWSSPDTARLGAIIRAERSDGRAFRNALSRGTAVADTEGTSLTFASGDHVELLGLASGIDFREGGMFGRVEPDPGWARREATRIRDAAEPKGSGGAGIWVAFAFGYPGEERALEAFLDSAGGAGKAIASDGRGATLYYYRFPRP